MAPLTVESPQANKQTQTLIYLRRYIRLRMNAPLFDQILWFCGVKLIQRRCEYAFFVTWPIRFQRFCIRTLHVNKLSKLSLRFRPQNIYVYRIIQSSWQKSLSEPFKKKDYSNNAEYKNSIDNMELNKNEMYRKTGANFALIDSFLPSNVLRVFVCLCVCLLFMCVCWSFCACVCNKRQSTVE